MKNSLHLFVVAVVLVALVGCQRPNQDGAPTADVPPRANVDGHSHGHGHDHGEHGPRGGVLVELGAHEFHAELVHDTSTGEIVVYLLDANAAQPAYSSTPEAVINLMHHGQPEQHPLIAAPMPGDPDGQTSRFIARNNPDLPSDLAHSDARARLQVEINGKPLVGHIPQFGEHDHDHD